MSQPVELQPAFAWTCPECGARNFLDGVRVELTPAERAKMTEDLGTDGDWLTHPDDVTCPRCKHEAPVETESSAPPGFDPHEAFGL